MNIAEVRAKYPEYDDLSDDELLTGLHAKFYSDMPKDDFMARAGAAMQPTAAEETGALEAGLIGMGKTGTDLIQGAQDLYYQLTGDDSARADLNAKATEDQRLYDQLTAEHPTATMIGEAVPYFAVPGAGAGAGLGTRIATEAAIGGGLGGLEYDQNALEGAAWGAGGGMAGGLLGAGLKKLAGGQAPKVVPREHGDMIQKAEALGWTLTPGQKSGTGQLDKLESGMSRNPMWSAPFDRAESLNQDLTNRIAREALGEDVPQGMLTDNILENAADRIGRAYDELTPKNFAVDLANDNDFLDELANIDTEYMSSLVRSDQWPKIRDRIIDMASTPMTAKEYHRHTSELAKKARAVGKGENNDPVLEQALYEARQALDNAFDRALPGGIKEKLGQVRGQYKTLMRLQKPGVVKGGNVRVMPLRATLKREGKGRVRGDSPLANVARVGEHFSSNVGSSGTPEGMAMQTALANPTNMLSAATQTIMANTLGRGYLRGGGMLEGGYDLGQATAGKIAGGVQPGSFSYLSPDQIGRILGLSMAPEDEPR